MELKRAQEIASVIIADLSRYCSRIEVAGSIRRKKEFVHDIDIVCIPSDPWRLTQSIFSLGPTPLRGPSIYKLIYNGVQVDIYVASKETWATLLLIRTGSKENNIRLCSIAKRKGWHLFANGSGLYDENNHRLAGDTEQSIYTALGLSYQEPQYRI